MALTTNLYENREISWLRFNLRVLKQATHPLVPLLERLNFLAIYGSNLDEFFMVRIGSLSDQSLVMPDKVDEKTNQTATQQIEAVMAYLREHEKDVARVYKFVKNQLKKENIDFVNLKKLDKLDQKKNKKIFNVEIKPLLTVQIIDPHHPFPFLRNNEHYIACSLEDKEKNTKYALISLSNVPKFSIYNINNQYRVVLTTEMISFYLSSLFKKYTIKEQTVLRVTRNADLDPSEELIDEHRDFRDIMKELLKKRRRLGIVRVQVNSKLSEEFLNYFLPKMKVTREQLIVSNNPLDLTIFFDIRKYFSQMLPNHLYQSVPIVQSIDFNQVKPLDYLSKKEMLLAFPYQSSQPLVSLIYACANDPSVVSIKISLYRLASQSRIVSALIYASEMGKEVVCLLELRARFDEQNNIDYSSILEESGCHIIYGMADYKVHSKVMFITRRINNVASYITYIGTGNFNEKTMEQYTDLGYITSDQAVGEDADLLFDGFGMNEVVDETQALWIAPKQFRFRFIEAIDEEIAYHQIHGGGQIVCKFNSMNDMVVMNKLVEASQVGVDVFLIIRGIACLKTGIEGYSEKITIKSIIGQYLEHSRIARFGQGPRARYWLGSGDLLNRNTQRRVEVFVEVKDKASKEQLEFILSTEMDPQAFGWYMDASGEYRSNVKEATYHSQNVIRDYFSAQKAVDIVLPVSKPSLLSRLRTFFLPSKTK